MKKFVKLSVILLTFVAIVAGCSRSGSKKDEVTVKLGVIGDDTDIWDDVKERLKDEGINIEYVKFSNNQVNGALAEGSIDLNSCQHQIYLDNYNEEFGTDLVSIGNTINAPISIYSDKIKDIKELKDGAEIAIPNDVTNSGRALNLLQTAGLIKIDPSKKLLPTVSDITENKKKLKITELDAMQTPRVLQDVDASIINSGIAVDAGLIPSEDAVFMEPLNDDSKPYVNIIVARKEDADNEIYNKVVDAYQTDETKKVIDEKKKGSYVAAWEIFGRK